MTITMLSIWRYQPLLLILFVLSIFGVGYQNIPIFTWLFLPVAIYYIRLSWWHCLPFFVVNTFGNSLAFLGSFNLDETAGFSDAGLLIGITAAVNILTIICFALDRAAYLTEYKVLRVYMFPFFWTGVWNIFAYYSPLGDLFTYSQSAMTWNSFRQIASFGGRAMLDFFMVWFGTVVVEVFGDFDKSDDVTMASAAAQSSDARDMKSHLVNKLFSSLSLFCLFFALLLGYGGGQISILPGSFYQKSYSKYITRDVIRAGCVIGNTDGTGYSLQDRQYWFAKTEQLAKDGAKLVLWSEETYQTFNTTDLQSFLNQASSVASNNSIYLGVSYINNTPGTMENLLTLISPNGTILITYNKAHPVLGVEDQPPGPNVLQYVDTPDLGRVGVGICFDFNFPSFMDQAGANQVDLMLQASWTWGPIGTFHARGNSLRAIENGFTMLRCGSQGMSGVFTATSDSPYQQNFATLTNQTLIFQVPLLGYARTTYTVFKGAFGWLCLAIGLCLFMLIMGIHIIRIVRRKRTNAQALVK